MKVDLGGGDWIELTDRINYAQMRRIRATSATGGDTALEGVASMARGWLLHDAQGAVVPFPGAEVDGVPSEAFDAVPFDVMLAVMAAAADSPALQGLFEVEAPNAAGSTSPESSTDSTPTSMPSSRKRFGSPTIQAGTTPISNPPPGLS